MNTVITLPAFQRYQLLGIVTKIAGILVIVAIPVLLTTTSLRFVINLPQLYEYGFDEYNVSQRAGISDTELTRIAGEIRDYFNSDEELVSIQAVIFGEETDLFTQPAHPEPQRQIVHMRDVKGLVQGVYLWQWVTLGYVLAFLLSYLVIMKRAAVPILAKRTLFGGVLTLSLLALLGLGAVVGFDSLFLKFHELGFSNDLWKLDPRDNLIIMFPQDFFFNATILVALLTIGQALLLMSVAGGYLYWRRRKARLSESSPITS